jgi:hypothetical protein
VANRSRSTFKKRQKELARQQRQQDKLARRLQKSKERQEGSGRRSGSEDPDIAGILPGPQPPPDDEG